MAELDKKRAVYLLNRILESELAGVVRYTHYSFLVFGHNRIPIVSWLREQAAESLTHAQQAGEMITLLGEYPSLAIGPLLDSHQTEIGAIMRESLETEAKALGPKLGKGLTDRISGRWDASVLASNVAKLLELERSLLDHAHQKMAIIDAMGLRTLRRLYEDRHLSAHPAFVSRDDLYEPGDELVRAHMTAAVDLVLAQRPVQGRGIFEAFSRDIQSPGFSNVPQTIVDYVEHKYLANMRGNVLRNFGVVLGKCLIQKIPPEWEPHRSKLPAALLSLKLRRPEEWSSIETELVKLINDDGPANRLRSITVLASFPELVARLEQPTLTALRRTVGDDALLAASPEAFAAVEIDQFRDELVKRFEALDDTVAARVLTAIPNCRIRPCLWGPPRRRDRKRPGVGDIAGERVGEEVANGANPRWALRSGVRRVSGERRSGDRVEERVPTGLSTHARTRAARVRIPAATRFFGGAGL